MSNYTEESKKIYNEVCDKYKHHWLNTTITQTMAMEMINKALAISRVVGQSEQYYCQCDIPVADPVNPYSNYCYKCGDKMQ